MICALISAAVISVVVLGIVGQFSGRGWACSRLFCSVALTASLLACAVVVFIHPDWDTSQQLGLVSGRGAFIAAVWQFFISIGNKPAAFVFTVMAVFVGRASVRMLGDLRSGDYRGTEQLELEAKMVALAREIKAVQKQIAEGMGTTYETHEEAETAVARVNSLHKEVSAQQRELLALNFRLETLRQKSR